MIDGKKLDELIAMILIKCVIIHVILAGSANPYERQKKLNPAKNIKRKELALKKLRANVSIHRILHNLLSS